MSSWMESVINLQNAISFFLVLQAPQTGGELFLFNQEWNQISFPIRHESYEDRHDIEGNMFKKMGAQNVKYQKIMPFQGKGILFRAAQIWHDINKIEGNISRITIGCFIAKGKDGKIIFGLRNHLHHIN